MELKYIVFMIIKILISVPSTLAGYNIASGSMSGHLDNIHSNYNPTQEKQGKILNNHRDDDNSTELLNNTSQLAYTSYKLPDNIFNNGQPFYLEKEQLKDHVHFVNESPDDQSSSSTNKVDKVDDSLRVGSINGLYSNLHDFLGLPIKYSSNNYSYPMISGNYANTKIQGNVNKNYHQSSFNEVDGPKFTQGYSPTYENHKEYKPNDLVVVEEKLDKKTPFIPSEEIKDEILNSSNSDVEYYDEADYPNLTKNVYDSKEVEKSTKKPEEITTTQKPTTTTREYSFFDLFYDDEVVAATTTTLKPITKFTPKTEKSTTVPIKYTQNNIYTTPKPFHNVQVTSSTINPTYLNNAHNNFDNKEEIYYDDEKDYYYNDKESGEIKTNDKVIPSINKIEKNPIDNYGEYDNLENDRIIYVSSEENNNNKISPYQNSKSSILKNKNTEKVQQILPVSTTTTTEKITTTKSYMSMLDSMTTFSIKNIKEQLEQEKVYAKKTPQNDINVDSSINNIPSRNGFSPILQPIDTNTQNYHIKEKLGVGSGYESYNNVPTKQTQATFNINPHIPIRKISPEAQNHMIDKNSHTGSSYKVPLDYDSYQINDVQFTVNNQQNSYRPGQVLNSQKESYNKAATVHGSYNFGEIATFEGPTENDKENQEFNGHQEGPPFQKNEYFDEKLNNKETDVKELPQLNENEKSSTIKSVDITENKVRFPTNQEDKIIERQPLPQKDNEVRINLIPHSPYHSQNPTGNILNLSSKPTYYQLPSHLTPPKEEEPKISSRLDNLRHPWDPRPGHFYSGRPEYAFPPRPNPNLLHKKSDNLPNLLPQFRPNLKSKDHYNTVFQRNPLTRMPLFERPKEHYETIHRGPPLKKMPMLPPNLRGTTSHPLELRPNMHKNFMNEREKPFHLPSQYLDKPPNVIQERKDDVVETLQMIQVKQHEKEFGPSKSSVQSNVKSLNKTDNPVYVVYPVNSPPIKFDTVDMNDKENIVIGTRAESPQPPSQFIEENPIPSISDRKDSPVLNPRQKYPSSIKSDFPYALEKPEPPNFMSNKEETEPLKNNYYPTSNHLSTDKKVPVKTDEPDSKYMINYVNPTQNMTYFKYTIPQSVDTKSIQNGNIGKTETDHEFSMSTSMQIHPQQDFHNTQEKYLKGSSYPQNHVNKESAPNYYQMNQDFQAPFQASVNVDIGSSGWTVISDKSKHNSLEEVTTPASEPTTQFDISEFKPKLESGFKPIYSYMGMEDMNLENKTII